MYMRHMRRDVCQRRRTTIIRANGMNRRIITLLRICLRTFAIRLNHITFMVALRHDECRGSIGVFEIQDHSIVDEDNSGN